MRPTHVATRSRVQGGGREALNRQTRKIIKTRGSFPSEDSARKLLYLAITRAQRKWRSAYNWSSALTVFRIHFADRIPNTAM